MVTLSSDCLRLGRDSTTHASAYGALKETYHMIKINNCVTCKCKVKILGGVPASGTPVVPTPPYRCICQVTSHILLQFSTKLQITYHFLTQISKLATAWRIVVISLKSSLKKLKQVSSLVLTLTKQELPQVAWSGSIKNA